MPETPIGQRLKILIDTLRLDVRTFSQRIDVAETTTRNYLNRGTKPGTEYLEKINNAFNEANLHWLLSGKGEPLLAEGAGPTINSTVSGENSTVTNIGKSTGEVKIGNLTLDACKQELLATKSELQTVRAQLEGAQNLLASKDIVIASKEETITLLRALYNRPN